MAEAAEAAEAEILTPVQWVIHVALESVSEGLRFAYVTTVTTHATPHATATTSHHHTTRSVAAALLWPRARSVPLTTTNAPPRCWLP